MRTDPLYNGAAKRPRRPGLVNGSDMERALIHLLHAAAIVLVVMSVLGTFYGVRGQDAPLDTPLLVVADIAAAPAMLVLALLGQGLLSVVQWGARQRALSTNPRWWLLYFGALALSVWWNWQAYYDPMVALGMPWLLAIGILVGGDVLPEWAIVKD